MEAVTRALTGADGLGPDRERRRPELGDARPGATLRVEIPLGGELGIGLDDGALG